METATAASVTLLENLRQAAWRRLQELAELERQHGSSWELTMARQERTRDVVRVLSVPDNTPVVMRTAAGLQVVS